MALEQAAIESDGRTYLKHTNLVINQDGSQIAISKRVDIAGHTLPKSGNISFSRDPNTAQS